MKKIARWLNRFKHRKSSIVINPYTDTQEDMQDKLIIACVCYLRSKHSMEVGDRMLMVHAALCDEDDYTATIRTSCGAIYETTNLSEEEKYSLKNQTK